MIYLELFWSFFQVGLFSVGGGYAAMPLIQNQVVDIHPWLTQAQALTLHGGSHHFSSMIIAGLSI